MGSSVTSDSGEMHQLLQRAARGDRQEWGALLERHRKRLRRMVALRLTSSAALAAQLLGHDTRPSEAAIRAERKIRLQEALNRMDPLDREVLALRHFEQLNNAETAQSLGLP